MAEYIKKKAVTDWLAAKKREAEDNSNEEYWEYRNVATSCEYDGQRDAFEETETFINSLPTQEVNATKVSPWEDLKAKFKRRRRWWGL